MVNIKRKDKTGIERCRSVKKAKKIDKIVRGVLIYWVLFVLIAWITFWVKDSVPDILIQYGLGGGAVELLVTGLIEIARDRMARKEERKDDN